MNLDIGRRHRIGIGILWLVWSGMVGADEPGLDHAEHLLSNAPQKALAVLRGMEERSLSIEQQARRSRLLCEVFLDIGDPTQALQAANRASGQATSTPERIATHLCQAMANQRLGNVRAAVSDLATARRLADQNDDVAALVRVMLRQGDLLIQQGKHDQAFALLFEAYEQVDDGMHPKLRNDVLNSLATVYYNTGRFDLAERYYRELVSASEADGDKKTLAIALFNLGHALASQRRFGDADAVFVRSLALSRDVDDQLGAAFTLKAWAESAQAQHDPLAARARLQEALSIFDQAGEVQQLALVHRHLGDLARTEKSPGDAIRHYLKALPVLEKHRFQDALARTYRGLAEAYGDLGDYERAYAIHRAYAILLKEHLEQQSLETTQRLQAQFETQRLTATSEKLQLENARQQQQLEQDRQRLVGMVVVVILALVIVLLILMLWRRGRQFARKMQQLATVDELTQVPNRRAIQAFGDAECQRAERFDRAFCCLLLDIDHFKSINDTFGHAAGDDVLRRVAMDVKAQLRRTDAVGRFGGEEFLIVATESDLGQAAALAERIRAAIAAGSHAATPGKRVTVSIGVAQFRRGESLEAVIEQADRALYQAKDQGRDQVVAAMAEDIAGRKVGR